MTNTAHRAIAANVRAEVARRQMRHGAVARHLGYTPQAFSRRLAGDVPLTAVDLQRLASLLEVTVDTLLAGTEPLPAAATA